MPRMKKRLLRLGAAGLLAVSGGAGGLSAATFVAPAENVVVFRRDRLPLDVDSMAGLAGRLLTLAQAQGGATAADRRGVAQMLALVLALKPEAKEARSFAERFAEGRQQTKPEAAAVTAARALGWQALGWLDTAEAGTDGRALAACLGDVMSLADPKHPRALEWRAKGERGAWANWVQPLAAFEDPAPLANEGPTAPPVGDPPKRPPEPEDPEEVAGPIKLEKASLNTVVWAAPAANQPRKLMMMPLVMTAALRKPESQPGKDSDKGSGKDSDSTPAKPEPFSCRWENPKAGEQTGEETESFGFLRQVACEVVTADSGPLPADVRLTFRPETSAFYRVAKDPVGISASLAVLAHAAVSGIEPQGTVIGEIRRDGSFRLPADFWERLRALSGKGGGRLVLPAEAEAFLPSILVFEDPGFFLDYEILFAADFGQLIACTARKASGELADAAGRFAEMRGKRGNQAVSAYVANRFVRQRLDEIARLAPYHASARMLAIQGAGQRPAKLTTPILATELLMVTRSTDWIVTTEPDKLEPETLATLSDGGRKRLDSLERLAEMRDRALVDQANDLLIGLRTFSRAIRKRTDSEGNTISRWGDFNTFKQLHQRITTGLKAAAGPAPDK